MPMIVDPGAPLVVPPARVTSPDGYLAATVDELWAGVVLAYNANTPPSARNLTLNPSLEVDLANTQQYAGSARERVTTDSRYGIACAKHTAAGATSGMQYLCEPVAAGVTIRASAWVKVPGTGTTVFFAFRDATTTHGTVTAGVPPVAGQWVRMSVTYTVPAGKTVDRIAVAYTAPAGTVWYSDAVMIQTGAGSPSEYIDGSLPGGQWEGAAHASPSVRVTALPGAAAVRQVRIVRQDPGAPAPVPVRSADPAWAIGGAGTAYDHEAPLGVAVIYTATPLYADGTTGPSSSLAVTVPAPAPGQVRDVWLKSIDNPSLSLRAVIVGRPEATAAGRQDVVDVPGSPYRVVAYDQHAAEAYTLTIDVPPQAVDQVRRLLRSGVLLLQTRPGYVTLPDAFHVPADITGPVSTGRLGSSGGYQFSWAVEPVARPDTAGAPLRIPGWSWDTVAQQFATWDAVAASYSSWASLSTNGVT
ncbi:hypothetical protein R2B67_26290 [Streptomyces cyaneofuscatus]|uniref:hypothetical protein n=1 Tax=Streptomyces cyaneofuscatus TaxID=66883 RepID=UPI002952A026|nr:hypothetical protein [Streptomyces cyaneofuscatus]WOP11831.1 hypothetical protein R2B67_26290 [Streptomyces cyaneofuscatus]